MLLVFATGNEHKVEEVKALMKGDLEKEFEVVSLREIGCRDELPEEQDTLEGNALQKARWVRERYGLDCFADDTGLEVEALGGAPGVRSARYAGEGHDAGANMRKLLVRMAGVENRRARFRTVIALLLGGREYLFEGTVEGEIMRETRGAGGFGYDPVFRPEGFDGTFGELDAEVKNRVSHRGMAVGRLVSFLREYAEGSGSKGGQG